jgi:glycosyltransferase involved in cell wall biosynthesis
MTVLFLYTELAEYFIKCCEELSKKTNVHIIRWPVNKEAPFEFSFTQNIRVYDKNKYDYSSLEKLIKEISPDLIVCSGWIDKDYLRLVKPYSKKIPTVLTCDTHWSGSLKQYAAIILSRFFLLNKFSHAWVPGTSQANYVKKLGFEIKKIKKGFYCCDLKKFNEIYNKQIDLKRNNFPKKFLFVGRYYDFKGIKDLWNAFIELQEEEPNEWELWCLGAGSITPVKHDKIKHFGFVQPNKLDDIIQQCGVFVLPSHFEPWGVVVQEYAASGFPLITSRNVGANDAFLIEKQNGFVFETKNVRELKKVLKKIITLSNAELFDMATESHTLAQKINPENWTNTLLEIYNEFKSN